MQQTLHAATDVDEGAELADRDHTSPQDRARDNRTPGLRRVCALLFLEQGASRHDEILAVVLVLDDPKGVHAADMHRRIRRPNNVDLRHRTEATLSGDAHLVSALHFALDLAFDRKARTVRIGQLSVGRRTAHQLPRERQPARGRHDDRLNPIANSHLDHAFVVLQFGDIEDSLALAAHIHEGHRRTDRDDLSLDRLPSVVLCGLMRRLEQGREIIFGHGHWGTPGCSGKTDSQIRPASYRQRHRVSWWPRHASALRDPPPGPAADSTCERLPECRVLPVD